MDYLTCNEYTGTNTPKRSLDLKSFFVNISEPASYGTFSFANDNVPFNGNSTMQFDMDVLSVSIRGGLNYREEIIGNWSAGFATPLVITSNQTAKKLKAETIYRVVTVVVSKYCWKL